MVRKNRFSEFMHGFSAITSKLKEMYQMITLGGDAELELVDSLDPFSEGINFRSACIIICVTLLICFKWNKVNFQEKYCTDKILHKEVDIKSSYCLHDVL